MTITWHKDIAGDAGKRVVQVPSNTYVYPRFHLKEDRQHPEVLTIYRMKEQLLRWLFGWDDRKMLEKVADVGWTNMTRDHVDYEPWPAIKFPPRQKPTELVAAAKGFARSEALYVLRDRGSNNKTHWEVGAKIDAGVASLHGTAGQESMSVPFESSVAEDPDMFCYVATLNHRWANFSFEKYLNTYVNQVAEDLHEDVDQVWKRLGPWITPGDDPAEVFVEDKELHLEPSATTPVHVQIRPKRPGRMMFVLCTEDAYAGDVSVSEVIGIAIDEDGSITREF